MKWTYMTGGLILGVALPLVAQAQGDFPAVCCGTTAPVALEVVPLSPRVKARRFARWPRPVPAHCGLPPSFAWSPSAGQIVTQIPLITNPYPSAASIAAPPSMVKLQRPIPVAEAFAETPSTSAPNPEPEVEFQRVPVQGRRATTSTTHHAAKPQPDQSVSNHTDDSSNNAVVASAPANSAAKSPAKADQWSRVPVKSAERTGIELQNYEIAEPVAPAPLHPGTYPSAVRVWRARSAF